MLTLDDAQVPSLGRWQDYFQLLKPRVMSLVVFTGLAGMLIAPRHTHPFLMLVAVLCIALSAGGAGAVNMWLERDRDARMTRTAKRPLPQGRVEPDDALFLGCAAILCSCALMGTGLNWLAAALLLSAALFYIFIYTIWLKPRTSQNIVIGGAAGALPPVIGWAAMTGEVSWLAISLFMVIFLWTPPHFWALALVRKDEYAAADLPMLPNTHGEQATKRQMLIYTALLAVAAYVPLFLGLHSIVLATGITLLNLHFGLLVWRFVQQPELDTGLAKKVFFTSIQYLFGYFLWLIILGFLQF